MPQPIKTFGLLAFGFALGLLTATLGSKDPGLEGVTLKIDGDSAFISSARPGTAVMAFGPVSAQEGILEIADGRSFMVADLWVRDGEDTIPCLPHPTDKAIPGCIPVPPPIPIVACVVDEKGRKNCFTYNPPRPLPIDPRPTPQGASR